MHARACRRTTLSVAKMTGLIRPATHDPSLSADNDESCVDRGRNWHYALGNFGSYYAICDYEPLNENADSLSNLCVYIG